MKFLRLLLCIPALLFVAFMRAVWPWWKIRVTPLISERIGHLAGNTAVYIAERKSGKHAGYTDLWTHHGNLCNEFFGRMLGRAIPIDRSRFLLLVILCNKLFQGWQKHIIEQPDQDRDIANLIEKHPPPLAFTEAEERRGRAELERMGVRGKFVCLMVRDSAYLPHMNYHAFRDSDINTYGPAAIELARRGYYVLRMGAKVEKRWPNFHAKVIDYASDYRSDFMDIYLGAKCEFAISSGLGIDAIPFMFKRPICYVNYAPIEYLFTFAERSMAIWKHYEKDGKRMPLDEVYRSGVSKSLHAADYEANGIKVVDNTPEEIRAVVLEMAQWVETPASMHYLAWPSNAAQELFWKAFPRGLSPYTQTPLHGEIRMRIGAEFLKQYAEQCTCGEYDIIKCKLHDYADTRTA